VFAVQKEQCKKGAGDQWKIFVMCHRLSTENLTYVLGTVLCNKTTWQTSTLEAQRGHVHRG